MDATVDNIMQLIEKLPETDFLSLQQRLDERAEVLWEAEATKARQEAADRGINQQAIDQAVARHRRRS